MAMKRNKATTLIRHLPASLIDGRMLDIRAPCLFSLVENVKIYHP